MFFELRQYRTRPGQREKWVKFMEEEIIPFQVARVWLLLAASLARKKRIYMSGFVASIARKSGSVSTTPSTKATTGKCHRPPGPHDDRPRSNQSHPH